MFVIAILAMLIMCGYYTTVYLRYKLLIWLAYRFLSGLAHHVDRKLLLKDTLFRAGLALVILYPLGWVFHWYATHFIMEKVDGWVDTVLWFGFLPIMLLTCVAFKVVMREFCTFCGLWEKDWSWSKPDLSIFHISPDNKPERSSRIPNYGDGGGSGGGFFDLLKTDCTLTDLEWDSYQRENYDRIYK